MKKVIKKNVNEVIIRGNYLTYIFYLSIFAQVTNA
jgi:hypothetical protein